VNTGCVVLVASTLLPLLLGQEAAQRTKLSDYPVHAQLPQFEIGADYLVHNIPAEKRAYSADQYLVVEVAIFPGSGDRVRVSRNDFTLRVNDKKILDTVSPGTVASALKYSGWERGTNMSAEAAGPGDVTGVGGVPSAVGRFPGDASSITPARAGQSRSTADTYGGAPEQNVPVDQAIANVALPDGLLKKPVKGCLFFRFDGKLKSIRSLELVYTDASGPQAPLWLLK
jgi:hypothetical protein